MWRVNEIMNTCRKGAVVKEEGEIQQKMLGSSN